MDQEEVFIIIPCFNEGQTIIKLIYEIEQVLNERGLGFGHDVAPCVDVQIATKLSKVFE